MGTRAQKYFMNSLRCQDGNDSGPFLQVLVQYNYLSPACFANPLEIVKLFPIKSY